jgi:hypothetical protein
MFICHLLLLRKQNYGGCVWPATKLGHGREETMYIKYLKVISFKNMTTLILMLGTQIMGMSGR